MSSRNIDHISPSEEKILIHIFEKGPTHAYHLWHNKKIDNKKIVSTEKTAITALHSLAQKGLLEKKEVIVKARLRKQYTLTLKGLCTALCRFSFPACQIIDFDKTATRWGYLLPILKTFPIFNRWKLEAFFEETLLSALKWQAVEQGLFVPENIEEISTLFFKYVMRQQDADLMVKWNHILSEEVDLRSKAKEYFEMRKRVVEQELREYAERLDSVFPEFERSKPDWVKIRKIEETIVSRRIWET